MTKFVFVTGGVVSSLGKGIASASLAAILESRGLKVTLIKLDPYINVDPGTMSPFQHGEVFVTDDGAETDLDLGHYERFITTCTVAPALTSRRQNSAALKQAAPPDRPSTMWRPANSPAAAFGVVFAFMARNVAKAARGPAFL